MLLLHERPSYFQFVPYFHFAEPYPRGVMVAYADSIVPDDELASAAEALRAAEVESVRSYDTVSDLSPLDVLKSMKLTRADLESMSIDEVRAVANVLDVPDRGTITETAALIEEILRRL